MNKVYVVFEMIMTSCDGEINESRVYGVYATRELAEEARRVAEKKLDEEYEDWDEDGEYDYEPEYSVEIVEKEVIGA